MSHCRSIEALKNILTPKSAQVGNENFTIEYCTSAKRSVDYFHVVLRHTDLRCAINSRHKRTSNVIVHASISKPVVPSKVSSLRAPAIVVVELLSAPLDYPYMLWLHPNTDSWTSVIVSLAYRATFVYTFGVACSIDGSLRLRGSPNISQTSRLQCPDSDTRKLRTKACHHAQESAHAPPP